MLNTKDKNLADLAPSMSWDDFKEDLEDIVNDSKYHSDKISETDYEKS